MASLDVTVVAPDGALLLASLPGASPNTTSFGDLVAPLVAALPSGSNLAAAAAANVAFTFSKGPPTWAAFQPAATLTSVDFRPAIDLLYLRVAMADTPGLGARPTGLTPPAGTAVPTSVSVVTNPLPLAFSPAAKTFALDTSRAAAAADLRPTWWPQGKLVHAAAPRASIVSYLRWDWDGTPSVGGVTAEAHPVFGAPALAFVEDGTGRLLAWSATQAGAGLGFEALPRGGGAAYADTLLRSAWSVQEIPAPTASIPPLTAPDPQRQRASALASARRLLTFIAFALVVVVVAAGLALAGERRQAGMRQAAERRWGVSGGPTVVVRTPYAAVYPT